MNLKLLGLVCFLSVFCIKPCFAGENDASSGEIDEFRWAISLYNGIYTKRTFGNTTFNFPGQLERKYMHGLGVSRKMSRFWKYFLLETEGMFVVHHGRHDQGRQNYEEYVLALLLRYDHFPWNELIHTSLAIGDGLSLNSRMAKSEVQTRGKSRRLLNYLTVELAFTLPDYPKYSLVYKIHHRSGVFGLFGGGIRGAADFYVLGLRYRF